MSCLRVIVCYSPSYFLLLLIFARALALSSTLNVMNGKSLSCFNQTIKAAHWSIKILDLSYAVLKRLSRKPDQLSDPDCGCCHPEVASWSFQ